MVLMKYKNIRIILVTFFLAGLLVMLLGSKAYAIVPPDHKKNYVYTKAGNDCAKGDFPVVGSDNDCIRLMPNDKGYTRTIPNAVTGCGSGGFASSSNTVYEINAGAYGHICINISSADYGGGDSALWDAHTYSSDRSAPDNATPNSNGDFSGQYTCGGGNSAVHISIDLGCKQKGNPILDMLFAVIRFLSIGVGFVIIGSLIVAGIQYTTSRGDPQATAKALGRVSNTVGALLLFIFAYAILNWLIPGAILK